MGLKPQLAAAHVAGVCSKAKLGRSWQMLILGLEGLWLGSLELNKFFQSQVLLLFIVGEEETNVWDIFAKI